MKKAPDNLPPTPLRLRLLILLLAVATAVTIVLLLIYRPGDPKRAAPAKPVTDAASGVGGKADVILLPSAASSPKH